MISVPESIDFEVSLWSDSYYLFGSKDMAQKSLGKEKVVEDSDWDFALQSFGTQESDDEVAERLGWSLKDRVSYLDMQTYGVYEKQIEGYKVQISCKRDLEFFQMVFESISPSFYWKYLHKSSDLVLPREAQTALFNQLYWTSIQTTSWKTRKTPE